MDELELRSLHKLNDHEHDISALETMITIVDEEVIPENKEGEVKDPHQEPRHNGVENVVSNKKRVDERLQQRAATLVQSSMRIYAECCDG